MADGSIQRIGLALLLGDILDEDAAKNHGRDPEVFPPALKALWDQLTQDWQCFCDEPYSFLGERLPGHRLPKPPKRNG